jgi:hypothetical protein
MESLRGLKVMEQIMRESKTVPGPSNFLDRCYHKLGLKELSPIDEESSVYAELKSYLELSTTATHHRVAYHIQNIFRVDRGVEFGIRFRHGLASRFHGNDRRLLWHGSRTTNFAGILSQGVRIAPPEAPTSGQSKSRRFVCPFRLLTRRRLHVRQGNLPSRHVGQVAAVLRGGCRTAGDHGALRGRARLGQIRMPACRLQRCLEL